MGTPRSGIGRDWASRSTSRRQNSTCAPRTESFLRERDLQDGSRLPTPRVTRCGAMAGVQQAEDRARLGNAPVSIESISAITLATHDMARSVRFYRALGFGLHYGGEDAEFTSFTAGSGYLNICGASPERRLSWWGRVIFHVSDVDAVYER